jgi:hypothetical protein
MSEEKPVQLPKPAPAALVSPPLSAYQFTGPSGQQQPFQQPAVGLTLQSAYPLDLQGHADPHGGFRRFRPGSRRAFLLGRPDGSPSPSPRTNCKRVPRRLHADSVPDRIGGPTANDWMKWARSRSFPQVRRPSRFSRLFSPSLLGMIGRGRKELLATSLRGVSAGFLGPSAAGHGQGISRKE